MSWRPDSKRGNGDESAPAQRSSRVSWQKQYARWLLVSDTAIVCAAVVLAQVVRFGVAPRALFLAGLFSAGLIAVWLCALAIFRTRSPGVIGAGLEEYRLVVSATVWTFGAVAIVTLLARVDVARGYLAVALPLGLLGLLATRNLRRVHVARRRSHGMYQTAVLAIGDRDAVAVLAEELMRDPANGYRVVGMCVPRYGEIAGDSITVQGREIPILGDETQALAAVHLTGADSVAVTATEQLGVHGIRKLTWDLESMNIELLVSPGVLDVAGPRLSMRPVAGFPLIHVEKPQYQGAQRFQKRAFDFCFALAAVIGMSPLLILTALAVKLTSRGPVFYAAERIGYDGKPFKMLKFRSMVDGADRMLQPLLLQNDNDGGVLFKMRDDPRLTRVGRFIRRTSIDELPQFFNVLKRDMSVVGPRPPLRREVETYDGDVKRKFLVKPGVTGLWQVSGRSDLSWEDSVRLDLSYVENWSMVGDLIIIGKTLRAVLTRDGAY
ncbi:sugar transferase [Mycobacterium sp. IDR2000157661]|nr:sugar transferase [Mycobacterium sp. IDR2000157661]ULE35445.1 sugar transferase [Mycobacterium sp. IDR2000157661]